MERTSKTRLPLCSALLVFLLSLFSLFAVAPCGEASSSGDPVRYNGNGTLSAYDPQGQGYTITINNREMSVDEEALVVSNDGVPTEMKKLKLPVSISYEYIYARKQPNLMAPVIVYIKVDPKSGKN